jgi:hypothetical protein
LSLSIATAAAATALCASSPALAAEKLATLGTAGVTGVYYPAGGAICRLVNRGRKEHGIRCVVESTGGSINNLEAVRSGDLSLGMAQSDWLYHAYNGTELFASEGPNEKLRVLFALHPEPFTIMARRESKIESFDQLKGKRVNIGNPGSGMRATMEELMRLKGWNEKSFSEVSEMKAVDQGQALCDKKIDAIVYAAGHPNGAVQQVTMMCDAKLIGVTGQAVDEFIQQKPYYSYATIPGNMYKGNPGDVRTFGVRAVVFASEDMDNEEAYQIVKAVFDNLENFKTLHPVFATLDSRSMVNSASAIAPLHEGAKRYYRERGLLK